MWRGAPLIERSRWQSRSRWRTRGLAHISLCPIRGFLPHTPESSPHLEARCARGKKTNSLHSQRARTGMCIRSSRHPPGPGLGSSSRLVAPSSGRWGVSAQYATICVSIDWLVIFESTAASTTSRWVSHDRLLVNLLNMQRSASLKNACPADRAGGQWIFLRSSCRVGFS